MLPNAFIGKPKPPTDEELTHALGSAKPLWRQLVADLKKCGVDDQEWNSHSQKAGWSLRLQQKKRNIVYLSPGRGGFMASFALGEKAMQATRESGFPSHRLKILNEAQRYAEGTAVRIEVKTSQDVAVVTKLAAIKLAN